MVAVNATLVLLHMASSSAFGCHCQTNHCILGPFLSFWLVEQDK